jgi:hypothetical protein
MVNIYNNNINNLAEYFFRKPKTENRSLSPGRENLSLDTGSMLPSLPSGLALTSGDGPQPNAGSTVKRNDTATKARRHRDKSAK